MVIAAVGVILWVNDRGRFFAPLVSAQCGNRDVNGGESRKKKVPGRRYTVNLTLPHQHCEERDINYSPTNI